MPIIARDISQYDMAENITAGATASLGAPTSTATQETSFYEMAAPFSDTGGDTGAIYGLAAPTSSDNELISTSQLPPYQSGYDSPAESPPSSRPSSRGAGGVPGLDTTLSLLCIFSLLLAPMVTVATTVTAGAPYGNNTTNNVFGDLRQNAISGHLNTSLVLVADRMLYRFNNEPFRLMMYYTGDYDAAFEGLDAPALERLLSDSGVGVDVSRPGIARGLLRSLDVTEPYDGRVTSTELEAVLVTTGWTRRNESTCKGPRNGYCPFYPLDGRAAAFETTAAMGAACGAGCPAAAGAGGMWPKLKRLKSPSDATRAAAAAAANAAAAATANAESGSSTGVSDGGNSTNTNATTTISTTPPGVRVCRSERFDVCMALGVFSCQACASVSDCAVHEAAVAVHGGRLYGPPLVVERDMAPYIEVMDLFAGQCGIFMNVHSASAIMGSSASSSSDNDGASASGGLSGRSFAVDLRYSGGGCRGSACAADATTLPAPLACFVNTLSADGRLEMDPEGIVRPKTTAAITGAADPLFARAVAYRAKCVPDRRIVDTVHAPAAGSRLSNFSVAPMVAASAAQARACVIATSTGGGGGGGGGSSVFPSASDIPDCLARARACGLSPAEANTVVRAASGGAISVVGASVDEATAARTAATCTSLRACGPLVSSPTLFAAVDALCANLGVVAAEGSGGEGGDADSDRVIIAERFTRRPAGQPKLVYLPRDPPGVDGADEYTNPWYWNRDTPLIDARAHMSSHLSPGLVLADAASRYVPRGAENSYGATFTAPLVNNDKNSVQQRQRNRFLRVDARLVNCLESLHGDEPIRIERWYETASEALARGAPQSRHRSGSAARVSYRQGNTPARMLDLAAAVVRHCVPLVRPVPTLRLALDLHLAAVTIDFRDALTMRATGGGSDATTAKVTQAESLFEARAEPGSAMDSDAFLKWLAMQSVRSLRSVRRDTCTAEEQDAAEEAYEIPGRLSENWALPFQSAWEPGDEVNFGASEECFKSFNEREALYLKMLAIFEAQHAARGGAEWSLNRLRSAAETCAMTCDDGELHGRFASQGGRVKTAACNALVHWLPYRLHLDDSSCHLAAPGSSRMQKNACFWGTCPARTSAYSTLRALFSGSYTGDAGGFPQLLYSGGTNPSPVLSQFNVAFGMHCRGRATVWVTDAVEVDAMRDVFRALMAFNRDVNFVDVRTLQSELLAVTKALEQQIVYWRQSLCKRTARDSIAPYAISALDDADLRA